MVHLLLATESVEAMRLSGALLDLEEVTVHVVSDGRTLLDRLNDAPTFYHIVVLSHNLSTLSGPECIGLMRQLHSRLHVLVLSDDVETDRLGELAALGIRQRHVMKSPVDQIAFTEWIKFTIDDLRLEKPTAPPSP